MVGAVATLGGEPEVDRPVIRQDLNLYPAGEDNEGNRIWHLHDPLANKFYQLQERDVELLALVGQKSAEEIALTANRMIDSATSDEEVNELFDFLRRNNLVRADDTQKQYYQEALATARQRKWWELAIRNPLFFRIPAWNPDRFLDLTLPYVSWIASKPSLITMLMLGVLGLYLVMQQLDQFFSTFLHFFNLSGAIVYVLVLLVVKVFHELGHAYTAKMMGCRVPVIGIAFMVGWPILYTDTSDAWKIPDKKRRLRIGMAGVGVELGIALISLFLWSVTPEGAMRSAFFLLSTTTWLLSIFVNFNPLMRFDGYYLLSDTIDMPNLEGRSFAMARWWLREKLFGLALQPPEQIRLGLVAFAFAVWTYRFFLFLGIALLVYGFFFKAAGIALFILEIIYFIARPIFNEIKEWWAMRDDIHLNDALKRTLIICGTAGAIFFLPLHNDVTIPAVFKAKTNDLYLPVPGQLVAVTTETRVEADEVLFRFVAPELELEIEEVRNRYEELSWIRSSQGFDVELRNEALIVESELRTQSQRLRTLVENKSRLNVAAPFAGQVFDVSPEVQIGDWLPSGQKLATIVDMDDVSFTGYLPENQLARVEAGMTARFYPENMEHGVHDLTITDIEFMGSPALDSLYVASTFGGDVAVRESDDGEMLTVQSQYRIHLDPLESVTPGAHVVRGNVVIDGKYISLFSQIRQKFVAVFIRETGF